MLWKREYKPKKNKWTKLPYQTNNPKAKAKCNDPSTWALFDDTLKAFNAGQGDGIGLAILGADDIGAFDLDDCRNAQSGDLGPAAQRLIGLANSYTEITPSDTGLRIILRAVGPKIHRRQNVPGANGMVVETYRRCERFITVTGNALLARRTRWRTATRCSKMLLTSSTLRRGPPKVLVLVHLPEVRPPLGHRHLLVAAEKGSGRSISKT
jgi:primase-polymerase (primpol)-like protein